MKRLGIAFSVLLLSSSAAFAQGSDSSASNEVLQECLLGTPDGIWAELKLTRDQLTRIKYVQEACKDECQVKGLEQDPNPISNADGDTVMAEVENILSKEQYSAWAEYCAKSTGE